MWSTGPLGSTIPDQTKLSLLRGSDDAKPHVMMTTYRTKVLTLVASGSLELGQSLVDASSSTNCTRSLSKARSSRSPQTGAMLASSSSSCSSFSLRSAQDARQYRTASTTQTRTSAWAPQQVFVQQSSLRRAHGRTRLQFLNRMNH